MVSTVVCRYRKQGYLFILRCTTTEKVHAILNLWLSADLLLLFISVQRSETIILTIPTTFLLVVQFSFVICICCFQQPQQSSFLPPVVRFYWIIQNRKKDKQKQNKTIPGCIDILVVSSIACFSLGSYRLNQSSDLLRVCSISARNVLN